MKLVCVIRKGWIKLDKFKEKLEFYFMWGDDLKMFDKGVNGFVYIFVLKFKLFGMVLFIFVILL